MNNMIEFDNKCYYIDFDAVDKLINSEESFQTQEEKEIKITTDSDGKETKEIITRTYPKGKEIDGAKFDTLGLCLQTVMLYNEPFDDALGVVRALKETPLNYRLAFNTLIKYGVIGEIEE